MKFSLLFFGVVEGDASAAPQQLHAVLRASALADEGGLAAVWLPERHFHRFGAISPNPAVLAAAVAVKTRHIRIRAGSVILPLHDPIRVAEDWSVVDNLSNGRVEIAFGSGWNSRDFVLAPKSYSNRRELMLEQGDTVRRLWEGGAIERESGSGQTSLVSTLPRPRQPQLPTWLTCQSEPTFAECGRRGYAVLTNLNFSGGPRVLSKRIATYREAFRPSGMWSRPYVSLMVHTFVGANREEAAEVGRAGLREYLESNLSLRESFLDEKGAGAPSALGAREKDEIISSGISRILEEGALVGSAEELEAKLARLEALEIDEVACLVDFIGDPNAMVGSVERLVAWARDWHAVDSGKREACRECP